MLCRIGMARAPKDSDAMINDAGKHDVNASHFLNGRGRTAA